MKPHVDTDLCMHAHVGFLAQGAIAGEYPDGCTFPTRRRRSSRSTRATTPGSWATSPPC